MAVYEAYVQRTVDYIEEHLAEELTLSRLARCAGFSDYHFHRIFQTMVGEPVMEYVRKRRLARAAYLVAHTDGRLLDIALDHGFGSHETFTRAFKKLFGMAPGEYRRRGIDTPVYYKANVLQRRYNPYLGGIQMEFKMVTKPEFTVVGYELKTSTGDGGNNREIPAFWQRYLREDRGAGLSKLSDSQAELGICTDFNMETGEFSYIIGMEVDTEEGPLPESIPGDWPAAPVRRSFPAATYAVFTTPKVRDEEFTPSIQQTWTGIFEEWFPHSGYEHAGGAEFELYDERSMADENGLKQMDIYIPVQKRQS